MTRYWLVIAAVFLLDVVLVWRTAASSTSVAVPTPPIVADADDGPVLVPVNFQGTRTEDEGRTFLESVS